MTRVRLADTDNRDALEIVEDMCIKDGISYEIHATPGIVIFGVREWRWELWVDAPDDTPKAA